MLNRRHIRFVLAPMQPLNPNRCGDHRHLKRRGQPDGHTSAIPASGTRLASNRRNAHGSFQSQNKSTSTLLARTGSERIRGRLIPPRAGIESPFLRGLAPGARLPLRHSNSMPPSPFKSDAPVLHQNCAPVRAGRRKTDCAAIAVSWICPSQIRLSCIVLPPPAAASSCFAGITHPPPKKCRSIPQTESSVNPWKLRAARREQKVRPAKAVPLFAAASPTEEVFSGSRGPRRKGEPRSPPKLCG
jgi:hypothetical protein